MRPRKYVTRRMRNQRENSGPQNNSGKKYLGDIPRKTLKHIEFSGRPEERQLRFFRSHKQTSLLREVGG